MSEKKTKQARKAEKKAQVPQLINVQEVVNYLRNEYRKVLKKAH